MTECWQRSSISELIKAYKREENLYNSKHKLYYNKQARNHSLKRITDLIKKERPETTLSDVTKKIQTLRTQFGQEVSKIEKSQPLGEDFVYKPKVWWYSQLEWIGDFMKTRVDSTPLSVKAKSFKKDESENDQLFDIAIEGEEVSDNFTEVEFNEIQTEQYEDSAPPVKKQKMYQSQKLLRNQRISREKPEVQTIVYTLNNDDTTEIIHAQRKESAPPETLDFHESAYAETAISKHKRRSKAFGKYIAALLMDFTDDKTFFELQRNITTVIQEASLNQQRKS